MHHPLQYTALTKIHQTEMLEAAAARRLTRPAAGEGRRPLRRLWMTALAVGLLALTIAWCAGAF